MHQTQENPRDAFLNIFFNVLLPVILLNQITKHVQPHGPTIALFVALAFPIGYGCYEYLKAHKKNWLSVLGVVNVLLTGGLALLNLEGFWFAVKEGAFPLLIGIAVTISAYSRRPFIEILLFNDRILKIDLIQTRLEERGAVDQLQGHIRNSTLFLSGSFYFSALLNFLLARWIFVDIDPALNEVERATILNSQIAQMTWLGFVVIAIPSILILLAVLWHLLHGIRKLTDLTLNDLLKNT